MREVMDGPTDVATLVGNLLSDSESHRKYAVFKLQALLSDPAFADAFIQGDGLLPLRHAVLDTTGNTLAYALGSLDALLELDMGWDCCDGVVLEKAVSLAINHPLVNIVRNALTLLVLVVSRPAASAQEEGSGVYGFRAIKSALDHHPNFLESLVGRLSASDHMLCANALQLVNALMRDAVVNGGEEEWPKFIRRLQDLGVIGGVGMLMRGDTANDVDSPLASAILEFQGLTKVLLKSWKDAPVSVEHREHKRALKTIHLLSKPEPYNPAENGNGDTKGRRHHPTKWRRLGFETESPALEFEDTGYLGMMDMVDYTRRNQDMFVKTLMEQSVQPVSQRCPLARASLSVTLILYEHFDIDETADLSAVGDRHDDMDHDIDRLYTPLLLQWGRLHTAGLNAFVRLWKSAGAEMGDYFKIEEVVRIVVERIVGSAGRKTDIGKIEEQLRSVGLAEARRWQMQNLDEVYQDAWGPHLVPVREQLHHESLQFMKEQRIRCLLQGSWFPTSSPEHPAAVAPTTGAAWRYVRLSPNRRWLHHATFEHKNESQAPSLAELRETLDLNAVTSVDSNVSTSTMTNARLPNGSAETLRGGRGATTTDPRHLSGKATTKITILGTLPSNGGAGAPRPDTALSAPSGPRPRTAPGAADGDEHVLLELFPDAASRASEWLDGLLMLLHQQPITKDTTRLVGMLEDWGVRLRILNLQWEDVDWEALERSVKGHALPVRPVPRRDGLEEPYWFAMGES